MGYNLPMASWRFSRWMMICQCVYLVEWLLSVLPTNMCLVCDSICLLITCRIASIGILTFQIHSICRMYKKYIKLIIPDVIFFFPLTAKSWWEVYICFLTQVIAFTEKLQWELLRLRGPVLNDLRYPAN